MIELINIYKTFNKGEATEINALTNISVDIKEQDFLIVVGSNGSGKSTFLNSIAGSFICNSGSIKINKTDVTKLKEFERAKWLSRVFQNPLLGTAPSLSILDNFRLASLRTQNKNLKVGKTLAFIKKVKDLISILEMGLENKIHQPVETLSGGQRQAITLLMSVMDNSKILLLDEPTAALDPKSAAIVMQTANKLIKQYQLTAILVTHNLNEAMNYGNRIIQMHEGKIIKDLDKNEKNKLSRNAIFDWFQ